MVSFDHICIVQKRIADAVPLLQSWQVTPKKGGISFGFDGAHFFFKNNGVLEVLEPTDEEEFVSIFIKKRGPGIHHITFIVPNIDEAVAQAKSMGYEIIIFNKILPWWHEAFLNPKQCHGILVQMVQQFDVTPDTPNVSLKWQSSWSRFVDMHLPPQPQKASLLGISMSVQNINTSIILFSQLLRANVNKLSDVEIEYTWPGSAMAVRCKVAKDKYEGPQGLIINDDTLPYGISRQESLGFTLINVPLSIASKL